MSPGVHKQPFRVVLQSPSLLVISLVLPDSWGSLFSPLVGDLRLQLPCFTAHVLRLYRFKQQEDSEGENSMRVSSTPWGPQFLWSERKDPLSHSLGDWRPLPPIFSPTPFTAPATQSYAGWGMRQRRKEKGKREGFIPQSLSTGSPILTPGEKLSALSSILGFRLPWVQAGEYLRGKNGEETIGSVLLWILVSFPSSLATVYFSGTSYCCSVQYVLVLKLHLGGGMG